MTRMQAIQAFEDLELTWAEQEIGARLEAGNRDVSAEDIERYTVRAQTIRDCRSSLMRVVHELEDYDTEGLDLTEEVDEVEAILKVAGVGSN